MKNRKEMPDYYVRTYKDMLKCGLTNEIKQAGFRVIETDIACWEFFQIALAEALFC